MTNVNLPVFKRTSAPADDVIESIKDGGFEMKGSALKGRLTHHENDNGIGLSVVDAPFGTVVLPSGPIRGAFLGENSVGMKSIIPESPSGEENSNRGEQDSQTRGSSSSRSYNV